MPGGKQISDVLLELYVFSNGRSFNEHILAVLEPFVPAKITSYSTV